MRLFSFFNKYKILRNSQHGFKANFSISTSLHEVLNHVTNDLDKRLLTLALFIDVFKAFDILDHVILRSKHEHYGVLGIGNTWFVLTSLGLYIAFNSLSSIVLDLSCE